MAILLILCASLIAGCSWAPCACWYVPKVKHDPYIPERQGCLRQMDKELPASPEAVEIYSRFEYRIPKSCITWNEEATLSYLMLTPFSGTEDFARLVVACLLDAGTPIGDRMPGAFLRAFAYQCEHYSDAVILQMAEILYSGKLSWRLSPTDALAFHFALVARFGMTRVNQLVARIYLENGQVLVPPVMFREFVPSIILEVADKVKNAPPAEHKALLQSIAFGYTGRLMTPTETIREFYKAYPCRTYAHELVERGEFAVMADMDLWLTYDLVGGLDTDMSPVLMFEKGFQCFPRPSSLPCVHSMKEWARMQKLGILTPGNLAAEVGITSMTKYAEYMTSYEYYSTWPRISIHYRDQPVETARLVACCEKRIPLDSVPENEDLGSVMKSILKRATETAEPPVFDLMLDLMMDEGLVPCKYFFPYFSCSRFGSPAHPAWHRILWDNPSEENLASFLHFFGSELVWNEVNMQFDWKDPARAAEIIANGVR
ncbi:MAG: hypothetical protein WC712_04170 [Candidatus Brocadiia bacterium]